MTSTKLSGITLDRKLLVVCPLVPWSTSDVPSEKWKIVVAEWFSSRGSLEQNFEPTKGRMFEQEFKPQGKCNIAAASLGGGYETSTGAPPPGGLSTRSSPWSPSTRTRTCPTPPPWSTRTRSRYVSTPNIKWFQFVKLLEVSRDQILRWWILFNFVIMIQM